MTINVETNSIPLRRRCDARYIRCGRSIKRDANAWRDESRSRLIIYIHIYANICIYIAVRIETVYKLRSYLQASERTPRSLGTSIEHERERKRMHYRGEITLTARRAREETRRAMESDGVGFRAREREGEPRSIRNGASESVHLFTNRRSRITTITRTPLPFYCSKPGAWPISRWSPPRSSPTHPRGTRSYTTRC